MSNTLGNSYLEQLDYESKVTLKFSERLPEHQLQYKPTEKSMEFGRLVGHIVEIHDWVGYTLSANELNWAKLNYVPFLAESKGQIIEVFQQKTVQASIVLEQATDAVFQEEWTMRKGDHVIFTMPKIAVLCNFVFNHFIHHRAQLGLYYKMIGIPVPSSYVPSGDM